MNCELDEIFNKPAVKIDGVYSFLRREKGFEGHWKDNRTDEIPRSKLDEAKRFLTPALMRQSQSGMMVLDAGCGDAVQFKIIDPNYENLFNLSKPCLVGLDISLPALARNHQLHPSSIFVHGDLGALPFHDEVFDLTYSYGVIAYTSDPYKSLNELVRVTKKGGRLGIWCYPKKRGLGALLFQFTRLITKYGGRPMASVLANLIIPFLGWLPTSSGISLRNASWKQCKEVVMVNIAPKKLCFFDEETLKSWFEELGIRIFHIDQNSPITIWGTKET